MMPPPGDPQRYAKFFCVQNQVSVYSETAASKRREECAKRQRFEIEEKRKVLRGQASKTEADEINTTKKKKFLKSVSKPDGFQSEIIPENDEKERIALLSQREFLIRSCGLIQMVHILL